MNAKTHNIDVVIVGSGAGAMTAAIRAHDCGDSVLVIEKSDVYGGSSAMSGGGIWIPNHGKSSTVPDSADDAYTYMRGLVEDNVSDERIHAYLDNAPEMLRYMESESRLQYIPQDSYCDYYPERNGGKSGGRTLDPTPYRGEKLQDEFDKMREQHPQVLALGRFALTMIEGRQVFSKGRGWMLLMARLITRYFLDIPQRFRSKRDRRLVLGNALIGRLRHSMMDRNIPLWLNTSMDEVIMDQGRACGVRVTRDGQAIEIHAKKGVILAAGGFDRNQAMRDKYLPQPSRAEWSAGTPSNTGDAIQAGLELGAAVDFMNEAWWGPAVEVENHQQSMILFVEKSLPGVVFINKNGQRYGNEAQPYQNYGATAYGSTDRAKSSDENVPAYAIFDANYRKKYVFGPIIPGEYMPDHKLSRRLREGFLTKADTLAELADKLGISASNLESSMQRFNKQCIAGVDEDFKRGDSIHDRYYGDQKVSPNPCLAPLDKAPFYGVPIVPGDLGTKGGLLTDEHARALDQQGQVIEGLYAIGNTSASVMGSSYPGAGSTLGPAMTFGYLAANHISQSSC